MMTCCRYLLFLIGSLLFVSQTNRFAAAWVTPSSSCGFTPTYQNARPSTRLYYSSEAFGNNSTDSTSSVVERLRVNGVSVSPKGFHVLLESTKAGHATTKDEPPAAQLLPLKMTNDPADSFQATSPESLTLCQLLSGVDMAGAILPPELLERLVACHIEDKIETLYDDDDDDDDQPQQQEHQDKETPSGFTPVLNPVQMKIWEYLQNQEALLREQQLYNPEATNKEPTSFRAQMPQVTLDQLTLVPFGTTSWQCKLECALPQWKETMVVTVKPDLLASLAYNYDPESSPLFTCVALALRYKAPIVLRSGDDDDDKPFVTADDLDRDFPQRTTVGNLQEQSHRVMQTIETGFEIHKLQGALQIAMRLGDHKAAQQIRQKLDEYDSMDGLKTLETEDSGSSDRLDDLENNILQ